MDNSGLASPAVLLTIVALGAAGVVLRPEPEHVAPARVLHRDPPGPAQIELVEASLPSRSNAAPEPIALFGVDGASAISVACGGTSSSETFTPERVACELATQAVKRVPKAHSEYLSLLLPSG